MNARVFLLSPAQTAGKRARLLTAPDAGGELAARLRNGGVTVGELFAFVSSLYFRGKLAYSEAFASPPTGCAGQLVIAPGVGLIEPERTVTRGDVLSMAQVPVETAEARYPLVRDALRLRDTIGPGCDVVLLGSVASAKYTAPLLEVFGTRLLFPRDFVGRGDMSRGGLMLRCAREGKELEYVPVLGAVLRGKRPPRLAKLSRRVVA